MPSETKWFIHGCLLMVLITLTAVWLRHEARGRMAQRNLEFGLMFLRAKQWDPAMQSFENALQARPLLAAAHYGRARVLLRRNMPGKAAAAAARALELGFGAAAHRLHADALVRLQRLEEALIHYGQALQLDPDDALAYEQRAGALLFLRRPQEALADYDQALKRRPYSAELYYNRGLVHRQLGNKAAAERDTIRARKLGLR